MRNVIVLSISMFGAFGAIFSWSYLFPVHLRNLGATESEIGIAYAVFGLALTLFQVVGGILADRFGRKLLIVVPLFVTAPLIALLLHTDHWSSASLVYVLISIFGALQFPAFSALLAESTHNRQRAFIWFEAALSFGSAFGPIMGAYLLFNEDLLSTILLPTGMANLFAISALLILVASIIALFGLKETKEPGSIKHENLRLSDIVRPDLRWFFVSGSFVGLVLSISIVGPFVTLHLDEVLLQTQSNINLFWAVGWGIAAILSLFGERIVKHLGAKAVLMWSGVLHPLLLLIWVFVSSQWHVVPFIASFFFAQFILVGNHMMIAQLTTPSNRGRIAGVFGAFVGIIRSFGPLIAMEAKIHIADWLPFGLALVWGVIAFIALIPCRPKENDDGSQ